MTNRRRQATHIFIVSVVVLLAFALRVYRVSSIQYANDEALAFGRAYDVFNGQVLADLARHAFYSIMLAPQARFLTNNIGMRWLSVLSGTLSIAMAFRVGHALGGKRTGYLAAMGLTLLPIMIVYSQYTKQYALVTLMSLTILWAVIVIDKGGPAWARWVYGIGAVFLFTLHAMTLLWLGVISGYLFLRNIQKGKRADWIMWVSTHTAIGVLVLLIILGESGNEVLPSFVEPPLRAFTRYSQFALGTRMLFVPGASDIATGVGFGPLIAFTLGGLIAEVTWRKLPQNPIILLLVGLAVVPPIALWLFSNLIQPAWVVRYLMASVASTPILIAYLATQTRFRLISMGLVTLLFVASMELMSLYHIHPQFTGTETWRDPLTYVADHMDSGEAVISEKTAITRYHLIAYDGEYTYSKDVIKDWQDGNTDLIKEMIEAHPRTWIVWSHDWDNAPPETLDPTRYQIIEQKAFEDMDVYLFTTVGE